MTAGAKPPPDPFSVDGLKARIEAFAPRDEGSREGRLDLYRELEGLGLPKGPATFAENPARFILHAIVQAHALYASERARALRNRERKRLTDYRRERERVEKQLQRLNEHVLIRYVDYDYYGPNEWRCPHRRKRRHCEQLHEMRERVRLMEAPPFNRYGNVKQRVDELSAELSRACPDWAEQPEEAFCRPRVLPVPPLQGPQRGRPLKELQNFLLDAVAGCLVSAERTVEEGCDFVHRVLRYCFGEEADARSLARQWSRLRKRGAGSDSPPA